MVSRAMHSAVGCVLDRIPPTVITHDRDVDGRPSEPPASLSGLLTNQLFLGGKLF